MKIFRGIVFSITSLDSNGLPSMASIETRHFLVINENLWRFAKFLSIKRTEALESSKPLTSRLRLANFTSRGIIKHEEILRKRIGPCWKRRPALLTWPIFANICPQTWPNGATFNNMPSDPTLFGNKFEWQTPSRKPDLCSSCPHPFPPSPHQGSGKGP